MFRSLAKLLGRERDEATEPLFGFSEGDIAKLKTLRDSEAFDVYLRALDSSVNLYAETLLSSRESATLHESRGIILGLRRASALVDELIQANAFNDERRQRNRAAERDSADRRSIALYGSPAWRNSSK